MFLMHFSQIYFLRNLAQTLGEEWIKYYGSKTPKSNTIFIHDTHNREASMKKAGSYSQKYAKKSHRNVSRKVNRVTFLEWECILSSIPGNQCRVSRTRNETQRKIISTINCSFTQSGKTNLKEKHRRSASQQTIISSTCSNQ